jgi:hypothetical protein
VTIHSNKGATGLTAPRTLRTERTARGRVPQLLAGLILLVGLACGGGVIIGGALTGCGVSSGVDAATTATVGATAGTGRTITSSTELHTPPTGSTPLSWLIDGDAFVNSAVK